MQHRRHTRRRRDQARRRRLGWLLGGLLALIVVAAGTAVVLSGTETDSVGSVTDAGSFDLPSLEGDGRVQLADFQGTPVVVNFFASWCTSCDAELPEFRQAADALRGDVAFVFVNSNEDGDGTEMARRHDLFDLPVVSDVGGTGGNGLYRSVGGPGGMPITAFYDARGELVDVVFGVLLDGALEDQIETSFGIAARSDAAGSTRP